MIVFLLFSVLISDYYIIAISEGSTPVHGWMAEVVDYDHYYYYLLLQETSSQAEAAARVKEKRALHDEDLPSVFVCI